jgi:fatty-acyl-CoA synthase
MSHTLTAQLERAARSTSGVRFVGPGDAETLVSYAELWARAVAVGGGLSARGVAPGDRVAIVLPTAPGFFDAFFGALVAGAVPVPLYPPVRLGRLDEYHRRTRDMLEAVGASLVLTDGRIHPLLGKSVAGARPRLGCVKVSDVEPAKTGDTYDLTKSRTCPRYDSSDDLAFIQFSSGTTAEPKPVALTHRQVMANVSALLGAIMTAYPEEGFTHAGVSWLPLYHDMGLVGCVLTAIAHPGPLTLIPPELFLARPALWLQAISRHRGTISPAPNFAYALCADRITDDELAGVDLSSWRVALNGAEPVTPSVLTRFVERFESHGLRPEALTPVYGLAEAALAVTFSDLRQPFSMLTFERDALDREGRAVEQPGGVALVSVGRALPGFAVQVLSADGQLCAEGKVGRVFASGPSIMRGYFGNDAATAAAKRGEWLDTGDLGFILRDELYLYGRAKDIIIIRGKNHAPQDIEQALDTVSGVRAGCSAALGFVPEGGDSEELVLLVERRQQDATDVDELRKRVLGRVAEATGLVPHRVEVLAPGTLPRTSSGKIRRAEAKERYLRGELDTSAKVSLLRALMHVARGKLSHARLRLGV